jgi:hypothetical protein
MSNTETLVRQCLTALAAEAELVDLIGAARTDGRRLSRRRRTVTGAVAVSAIATTGVTTVAVTHRRSRAPESVKVQPASTAAPKSTADPTPMATSLVTSPSGTYATLSPACPGGQLPNLTVNHNEPVDPRTVVLAPPGQVVVRSVRSQQFLVDGSVPPTDAHWVLAWNAAGSADVSVLSLNGGSGADPFGTAGYTAIYIGCRPNPDS